MAKKQDRDEAPEDEFIPDLESEVLPGPEPPEAPVGPTFLSEGGSRVPLGRGEQSGQFRVVDDRGRAWDHCHETPDGEWVYRKA